MILTLDTPAVALPVTLAEVKAQTRVGFSNDDTLLLRLVAMATEYVQNRQNLQLMEATWKQKYTREELAKIYAPLPAGTGWQSRFAFPTLGNLLGNEVRLPIEMRPVQSVTSVKYYDSSDTLTTVDSSTYYTLLDSNPPIVTPKSSGWNWDISAYHPAPVEVVFVAGWPTIDEVPASLKHAILLLVSSAYELRGVTEPGQYFREVPHGMQDLIDQYASGSLR